MADTKISGLTVSQAALAADLFTLVSGGVNKQISGTNLQKMFANLPDGAMFNGKISPSVATGNLTLALKTWAGANPSATDPVSVVINGAIYVITSSLSITMNAATNWMNLGGAELATNETDIFAGLLWDSAASAVRLTASRYPGGNTYGDYSSTSTNEKYMVLSAGTPASTDTVHIIGRFAATLSAGAGYTWTVPTYTADNLIQYPIYDTRVLTWSPAYSAFAIDESTAAGTYNTVTTNFANYQVKGRKLFFVLKATGTTSSTPVWLGATLPFQANHANGASGFVYDSGLFGGIIQLASATPYRIDFCKYNQATFASGATKVISGEAFYDIA